MTEKNIEKVRNIEPELKKSGEKKESLIKELLKKVADKNKK